MKLILATHVYPLNPRAPTDIPGNFLPPFIAELAKRGTDVHVLAPNRRGDKVADMNAPVTWFDWRGDSRNLGRFNPLQPLDALRLANLYQRGATELKNLIRRQRAEVVLACWAVPSGVFAESARRALGTPYAVWCLGSDIHSSGRNPLLRPLVKRALKGASIRYANSITLAREVERLSAGACDFLPTMRALPDVPAMELPQDRVNFLYAGRLERVKGVDLLLHAFAQLRSRNISAHLYLAGNGSLENELRAQAHSLGLDNDVTFLGFLSDAPLAAYLRAVDAIVIPSRAEALPVIFTEAARCGTPTVVTNVGDLGTLAREFHTSIVVTPENVEALCRGLIDMARADHSEFRKRMPELLEKFDYGRAAEKLLMDLETTCVRGSVQIAREPLSPPSLLRGESEGAAESHP